MSNIKNIICTRTYYVVRVFPFLDSTQEDPVTDVNNLSTEPFTICEEIIDMKISKMVNSIDQQYSFSLLPMKDYFFDAKYRIKPGDWLVIYKTSTGGYSDPAMKPLEERIVVEIEGKPQELTVFKRGFGQVERAEPDWFKTEDADSQTFFVSGRLFGKIFTDNLIFFHQFNQGLFRMGKLFKFIDIQAGRMSEILTKLLSYTMSSNQLIAPASLTREKAFPIQNNPLQDVNRNNILDVSVNGYNGRIIYDYVKVDFNDSQAETFLDIHIVKDGTAEQYIEQFSDRIRNEVYGELIYDNETKRLVPTLRIREKPFTIKEIWQKDELGLKKSKDLDRNYFEDLFTYQIDWHTGLVQRFKVGRSCHEAFNYFLTFPKLMSINDVFARLKNLKFQETDTYRRKTQVKMAKFGLKVKEGSTIYDGYSQDGNESSNLEDIIDEYTRLNYHWYSDMDTKYSGVVSGYFPNFIRVGNRLRLINVPIRTNEGVKKVAFEGYINGINDNFQPGSPMVELLIVYGRFLDQSGLPLTQSLQATPSTIQPRDSQAPRSPEFN